MINADGIAVPSPVKKKRQKDETLVLVMRDLGDKGSSSSSPHFIPKMGIFGSQNLGFVRVHYMERQGEFPLSDQPSHGEIFSW